jgi:hypothetical protein
MCEFQQLFGINPTMLILDVGGVEMNWSLIQETPNIVFLNLQVPQKRSQTAIWLTADGMSLPFKDQAFEIVFSNSVIEHLGSVDNQYDFSKECQRVGRTLYIQTPNKGFPIEPHLITPFIHWLPKYIQRHLLRNFTLWGWITRPSQKTCDNFLEEIRLLDSHELQSLFSGATIHKERFLGMVKSIIAIQQ